MHISERDFLKEFILKKPSSGTLGLLFNTDETIYKYQA